MATRTCPHPLLFYWRLWSKSQILKVDVSWARTRGSEIRSSLQGTSPPPHKTPGSPMND